MGLNDTAPNLSRHDGRITPFPEFASGQAIGKSDSHRRLPRKIPVTEQKPPNIYTFQCNRSLRSGQRGSRSRTRGSPRVNTLFTVGYCERFCRQPTVGESLWSNKLRCNHSRQVTSLGSCQVTDSPLGVERTACSRSTTASPICSAISTGSSFKKPIKWRRDNA